MAWVFGPNPGRPSKGPAWLIVAPAPKTVVSSKSLASAERAAEDVKSGEEAPASASSSDPASTESRSPGKRRSNRGDFAQRGFTTCSSGDSHRRLVDATCALRVSRDTGPGPVRFRGFDSARRGMLDEHGEPEAARHLPE